MPLPTNRTTANTAAEHVADHNSLHSLFNQTDTLRPTAAIAETFSRLNTMSSLSTWLSSGRLSMVAIYLSAGTTVTSVTFSSGGTAAVTPTNQWAALYGSNLALLRQSTDKLTEAWAIVARKVFTLTSPFVTTYSGLHYLGLMVAAATVPSVLGVSTSVPVSGDPPIITGTADTGLTTTAPNPAAALTASSNLPYAYVS